MRAALWALNASLLGALVGCCHPSVTAVPLSPWNAGEPKGIPFYLPKPLLVISKNFRYIEEAKVGLTNTAPIPSYFDNQAAYADVNSRRTYLDQGQGQQAQPPTIPVVDPSKAAALASGQVLHSSGDIPLAPNVAPKDGLHPETFYTYQIIFIPDLTQKYGLRIKGGVGEIRAAMNLVNGWQFTGLGPYYMKDSSTAQNIIATGLATRDIFGGAGDLAKSLVDLRKSAAGVTGQSGELDPALLENLIERVNKLSIERAPEIVPQKICNFAEIYIYEPVLNYDGTTEWRMIANHHFDRDFLQQAGKTQLEFGPPPRKLESKKTGDIGEVMKQMGALEDKDRGLMNSAVEKALGLQLGTLRAQSGELDGGGGAVPGNNVTVNVGKPGLLRAAPHKGPIQRIIDHCRPSTTVTEVLGQSSVFTGSAGRPTLTLENPQTTVQSEPSSPRVNNRAPQIPGNLGMPPE